MLPKVANQILQHTSRAVAAVQNQTGQTIRNVLQLQSSSGPSSAAGNLGAWNNPGSSSSGWGSSGPGAGGAKYHSSSRFHSNYSGVGRAAVFVDPSVSHASNGDSFDDPDEPLLVAPIRAKHRRRTRSSSLSFSIQDRDEQVMKIGVLKAIQLHLRARHAFASPSLPSATVETFTKQDGDEVTVGFEPPAGAAREDETAAEIQAFSDMRKARNSRNASRILAEIKKLHTMVPAPSPALYNVALEALISIRKPGESLQQVLAAYHDMIARSVVPNFRTYTILIMALADRDAEIWTEIRNLEARMRMRAVIERSPAPSIQQRVDELKSENAFGAALTLFQAACVIPRTRINTYTYNVLLRCCAAHGNVDAAIHVYAHLEKQTDLFIHAITFRHLIRAYIVGGDLRGAKEVFDEFRSVAQKGRLMATDEEVDGVPTWRSAVIAVWNEMIDAYFHFGQPAAALGLLEQMMDSPKGLDFQIDDVPLPAASTFSRVVCGFIESGDMKTALSWFDKLVAQPDKVEKPYLPVLDPPQPDLNAWTSMVDALLMNDMFDDLTRVLRLSEEFQVHLVGGYRIYTLRAYLQRYTMHPELLGEDAVKTLDMLRRLAHAELQEIMSRKGVNDTNFDRIFDSIIKLYLDCDRPDRALDSLDQYLTVMQNGLTAEASGEDGPSLMPKLAFLQQYLHSAAAQILTRSSSSHWSLQDSLRFTNLHHAIETYTPQQLREDQLQVYMRSSPAEKDLLSVQDWEQLLVANRNVKSAPVDIHPIRQVLLDMAQRGILKHVNLHLIRKATEVMDTSELARCVADLGDEPWAKSLRGKLIGGTFRGQGDPDASVDIEPSEPQPQGVRIDLQQSKYVEDALSSFSNRSPMAAYHCFAAGQSRGKYATPEVIAKLINALGRIGEVDKVRTLYSTSQAVLASLENNKPWQSMGWFAIEDAMIIALAHAGDVDAAHVHRTRILEQGGTPSADSYGALIQWVKDTTDDTSNAMALFQEALARGVNANIYLYNTAISKLAKARKADHALALFQEMQARGIRPTSVTYGAVIAACCRVGDAQSAEVLFQEMSCQPNFKPRVPPYNTMMQLYAHTKPDLERVLHYYNSLLEAKIHPTAHTYKLLLDAYGTIEPVDMDAMEETFNKLISDPEVAVQGTHWAALINAWGCARKDLDKAIDIFESIQSHPTTKKSKAKLPDAVVFEALMNVLVTLRRPDLIPVYTEKLASYGVHMTAYIANLLIKGYATAGDIERAREIFEGLSDPPEGVAAPNNHVPHDSETVAPGSVPTNAPVYREPSTWEAMVRAELGNGNRDQAMVLLERVQARRFPPAVYNRISGIMLDDSVSPWAQTPESSLASPAPLYSPS